MLSEWPVLIPEEYISWLNEHQKKEEEDLIEKSIGRGSPFGKEVLVEKIVKKLGLESTLYTLHSTLR